MEEKMTLVVLQSTFSICQFPPYHPIPAWVPHSGDALVSITRTCDELSIVCEKHAVPNGVSCVHDWSALMLEGPLAFNLVGILNSLLTPLAEAKISVFTLSTYNTDYILIQNTDLEKAIATLEKKFIIKK